jgi:hypothetical protein
MKKHPLKGHNQINLDSLFNKNNKGINVNKMEAAVKQETSLKTLEAKKNVKDIRATAKT